MRHVLALVGALLVLGESAGVARAQEPHPHVQLRWQAPAECPDDLALLRMIEDVLGQPLARAPEQNLTIDAHVMGDALHGYAAKLLLSSATATSERSMEHPDCTKLTEAAALLMALAIDPDRVRALQQASALRGAREVAPNTSPVAPPPAPAAVAPAEPARQPREVMPEQAAPPAPGQVSKRSPLRFHLGLMGLVARGVLPTASPGVGLELAAQLGWLEAAVAGRSWAARTAAVPDAPGAGVELSLMTAGLRVCAVPTRASWSLLACLRGDVGDMSGDGQGVDNARSGHARLSEWGGSLGLAYAVGRFSPRAGLELQWAAERPRFGVLKNGQQIQAFTPSVAQLTGFVGVAYEL